MALTRQQRTNYTRQKVKPGAPPVIPTIQWIITNIAGNVVTVQIAGNLAGLVINGTPGVRRVLDGSLASSWMWTVPPSGGTTAEFSLAFGSAITEGEYFEVVQGDLSIRNRFGGSLAANQQLWDPSTPPFPDLHAVNIVVNAGIAEIETDSVGDYVGAQNVGGIQNTTTGEFQVLLDVLATTIRVQSGGIANNPGDTFEMISPEPSIFDNLGNFLQDFSIVST